MRIVPLACSAAALLLAAPASAQVRSDPYQHAAITAGDYSAAESALRAERRIHPDRPEVLLNLATVLARTGRTEGARELYRQVLGQDDASLLLAGDRSVRAHVLAQQGLMLIDGPQPVRYTAR